MEKRKSKILAQYEEIIEEKNTLEENLGTIINRIFSCVERLHFFSGEMKQKDYSLILKHELEVLKKLTEINYDLEEIIEQNAFEQLKIEKMCQRDKKVCVPSEDTLKQLEMSEQKYEDEVPEPSENIKQIKSNALEIPNFITSHGGDEGSVDNEFSTIACSSPHVLDLSSVNHCVETQSNFSDTDIQYLRETLKKFSEKLGLNAECISSMKDYYEKPSTSCNKDVLDRPSTSQNTHDCSINKVNCTNFEATMSSDFEIPEKDTNVGVKCKPDVKENCADFFSVVELDCNTLTNLELSESKSNELCTDSDGIEEPAFQRNSYRVDSSSSTESTVVNCVEGNDDCTKSSAGNDDFHCPLSLSDINNDLVPNNIHDDKTEGSISKPKKIVYTALEKLNNTNFNNRREQVLNKIKQLETPDLKLRPIESQVIKNDLDVNSKLKKKKNKKKNAKDKDSILYELKPKPTPTAGMDCAFSHVESPNEFYIHVVDEESTLVDALTEQINEYLQDAVCDYESKEETYNSVGMYCFAFISEYSGWYRAHILEWYLDSKSDDVLLQLVDYGNKRRISYKNIQKLNKEMADIHMLAIRCHLPLMYPPHSTSINRLSEWPPETIDAIVGLSGLFEMEVQEYKIFKIVYAQEEDGSVAIDLYNQQETNAEQTVGQILLDLGLAVQIIDELDEENLEVEEYLQDIDSFEKADNINEAIIGYDPRDEARKCHFTKKDGTCYKGKNCKLEHVPLSRDGFTTDTEPVFKEAMYNLLLPTNGEVIRILITGYKDLCNFFAQIVRSPHKENTYLMDKDLFALLETMNSRKTVRTFEAFKIPPAIGEIVIAKHWSKKWLRAVVRERIAWNKDESEEYQVFTLDYGDYMQVPLSDLRKIKPNFLQLPFQVVECYIAKYKAKKDCDVKKAREFFQQNLFFHNFIAIAMSESLPLKVGIKGYNGFDVGKILAENGFAEERVYDKNPIDGCPLELY